ncbi:GFA family protein [Telmatospirillum sp. J64-1]|uniref:GFA family protein n=1 Tax=Telmatospirillum sp. J64-1 TaxID=2502183 RepID=UPI00115DD15F|nr:GFA family protein [Telmatospirillum sp. J64-1]
MPMKLQGSCRCGAVKFAVDSHTPHPYQRCYCSICRKTDGGGGYAINIMGDAKSLTVLRGRDSLRVYRAEIRDESGQCHTSSGQRHFCVQCGSALWLFDPEWPDWVFPFASAIDTDLPVPPDKVHLMLRYKASWVEPQIGPEDETFDLYPVDSIEDWHRQRGLWVE